VTTISGELYVTSSTSAGSTAAATLDVTTSYNVMVTSFR
jgi:hypothetical protein